MKLLKSLYLAHISKKVVMAKASLEEKERRRRKMFSWITDPWVKMGYFITVGPKIFENSQKQPNFGLVAKLQCSQPTGFQNSQILKMWLPRSQSGSPGFDAQVVVYSAVCFQSRESSDYCSDPGSLYYWGDVRRGGQRLEHFLKKCVFFFVFKKNVKKFYELFFSNFLNFFFKYAGL